MTKRLNTIRKDLDLDFSIVGIGGVMKAKDYAEYIAAGADAVQSAAGAMWNANLGLEVKRSLGVKFKKV